ncbi:cobalamin biosynthesis protein CbiG [Metallosphaera tengchongensis]|uniref:Cobalamin biosynthesis protein CbiG n=1 Tax=Metallosphaera tengchongensis TaxID=1532350 RepID=A0A6N0NSF8_9CREN|nr:cobalamin biosynthesis protein [Metallosphaera tengchongensis]QKQ99685.1 cobalamin biosynthesis protein CbiG [Metallosphaera tengchongensis]
MYVSRIRIIADPQNEVARSLSKSLEELGYFIVQEDPEVLVYFYPLGITVRKIIPFLKEKETDPVVISITDDASYVIPVIKEHRGGSFIGGLISDLLGSQLILTSRTSQMGLYSVEEFAWINGLEVKSQDADRLNVKLVKTGKIKIYQIDKIPIRWMEGFESSDSLEDADALIGENPDSHDKPVLLPRQVVVGLGYTSNTPPEVLIFSILNTMKSINIYERRLNFIAVPEIKQNDLNLQKVGRKVGASIIYVPMKELKGKGQSTTSRVAMDHFGVNGVCEPSLEVLGTKVVLKRTKRAYGVVSCLGVK